MPQVSVLDRIRKDNQLRLEQRKLELDRMEQELALKRSERKELRLREREQHDATESLISQINVKAVENSLLKSEIQITMSAMVNRSIELKQMDRRAKIHSERESFNVRVQRLNKLRQKLYEKRKPPVQVPRTFLKQPTAFYGIDFSTPTTEQLERRAEELADVSKQRENMLLQDPNTLNTFLKGGDIFIKALMDLRIGDDTSGALIDRKLDMMKRPLFNTPSPPVGYKSFKEDKLIQSKKWTELIARDEVDYSELFPSATGMQAGLSVFRIEDMKPAALPLKTGKISLCNGDCYLILKTFTRDETDGLLDWQIYQYIGSDASIDKKACSAIFAVGLRNLLGSSRQVVRIQSNDVPETKELLREFYAFGIDVEFSDHSQATESGLFSVEDREFPLLVYRFVNIPSPNASYDLDLLDPENPNFNAAHVYLIDNGRTIYVWNGKDSLLADRMICRLLAQNILKSERASLKNTHLNIIEDGDKSEEFLPFAIGGVDSTAIPATITLYRALYLFDEECLHKKIKPPQNYLNGHQISNRQNYDILKDDVCCILDCGSEVYLWMGKKGSFELKQFAEAYLVSKIFPSIERPDFTHTAKVMQGVEPEVFKIRFQKWPVAHNFRPPRHLTTSKQADEQKSKKSDISVLFSPPPTGKVEKVEVELCEDLLKRANSLLQSFHAFIYQPAERKFIRIPGFTHAEQDFSLAYQENSHLWTGEFYVFVCLYKKQVAVQPDDFRDSKSLAESFVSVNTLDASGSQLSRSAFLTPSRNNIGHHSSTQSLPKALTAPIASEKSSESSLDLKSQRQGYECVIYTWSSDETPAFGKLTFEFEFKQTIKDMVADMSQGLVQVNTVHLNHEKESIAFLAHLNNQLIIHRGKRMFEHLRPRIPYRYPDIYNLDNTSSEQLHTVRMFHIRTDAKLNTGKAIEVPAFVKSLCTRDCFAVINIQDSSSASNFLWVGKGVSMEEAVNADIISKNLFEFYHRNRESTDSSLNSIVEGSLQRIRERNEPVEFWKMLGPSFERPDSVIGLINAGQGFYHALPPPRLFCCSTQTGEFKVTDLSNSFTVSDLLDDNVYILDTAPTKGKPYIIWVWIGSEAQDLIVELSKKSLHAYLIHVDDGRFFDDSEWTAEDKNGKSATNNAHDSGHRGQESDIHIVRQGCEPSGFKAFFHGWGDGN